MTSEQIWKHQQAQLLFNRVARHLMTQGKKSLGRTGEPVYRSSDGLRCAIGCLIDDPLYCKEIEGKTIIRVVNEHKEIKTFFDRIGADLHLLSQLQGVHDYRFVDKWKYELMAVARLHNLSTEVLEEE